MGEAMITLHAGDCLAAPWRSKRNAWITDPPANIATSARNVQAYGRIARGKTRGQKATIAFLGG